MTDAQFDRRFRDWLVGREPGPLPQTLQEIAARVPVETPLPATVRIWNASVRLTRPGSQPPTTRLALALIVVGLLVVAGIATLIAGSSATPVPVPGLTSWGTFAVGRPAPPIVMRNVAGTPAVGDDTTFEFEDRVGSVVVVYVAADHESDLTARDVATLVEARSGAPEGVVFLVAAPAPESNREAVEAAADAGIGTVALPASWARESAPGPDAAFVVIDRHGSVAAAFGGELPGARQLIDVIDTEIVK